MSVRSLWTVLETLHDVTYFTPEAKAAHEAAGLRGFWRGYVATRAAPLGEASLGAVTAVFHNFAPSFLARSLPSVWAQVSPDRALAARLAGAVTALHTSVPELGEQARTAEAAALLHRIVETGDWDGRALGRANAVLPWPDDPLAAVWQGATALREHRGDGHVVTLVSEGIGGLEAHVLRDAADGSRGLTAPNRGWTDEEWSAAQDRLAARGLVTAEGALTGEGARLREHIERRTDELSEAAYRGATEAELAWLEDFLRPFARRLVPGAVPLPNPVGAPAP
ncbi:hypothetical protein FNH05_18315 [Amycolatopsis rhizosphaerae]|uniref:SalK n=1 Tax=Amycolatopsis rhizosphaerae TaxID=2053003 RepID=A0A558CH10_9PSEU|nr:hypothetical protein [Amycolatopsis rhizosphaerae]TVT48061.1 hypothetical protein FNH05_18315 [Amycolatopsis rhizosphaerae]